MKHIFLLVCLLLNGVAGEASTIVGRSKLSHPDLGATGGAGLHTEIRNAWTKLADFMGSRYNEFSGVADSAVSEVDHNFGVGLSDMRVLIYTGSHPALTRVTDPKSAGWVIAEKVGSEKTVLEITAPSSGGPHTFAVIATQGGNIYNFDNGTFQADRNVGGSAGAGGHVVQVLRNSTTAAAPTGFGPILDYKYTDDAVTDQLVARVHGGVDAGDEDSGHYTISTMKDNVLNEVARLTSGGSLGLGTSSPTFGNGGGIHINAPGGGTRATLRLSDDTNSSEIFQEDALFINNLSANDIVFRTNGTSEKARINTSGQLTLQGTNKSGQIAMVTDGTRIGNKTNTSGDGHTLFTYGNDTLGAVLRDNGNFGIGTGTVASDRIHIESPSGSDAYIRYNNSDSGQWTTGVRQTSGNFMITEQGWADKIIVTPGNAASFKVGINTTTPEILLDINRGLGLKVGNISDGYGAMYLQTAVTKSNWRIAAQLTQDNAMEWASSGASGAILGPSYTNRMELTSGGQLKTTTGTITTISDERLKENIVDLPRGGLSLVKQLRPVSYDWKYPEAHKEASKIGFIAQEVLAVAPEFVDKSGLASEEESKLLNNEKALGLKMNGPGFIAHLVKAIQELSEQNKKLSERIEELEYAKAG